MAISLKTW